MKRIKKQNIFDSAPTPEESYTMRTGKVRKPCVPRWALNSPGDQVTSEQWRMARAAIKIGMRELAKLSRTSVNSLVKMESGKYVHYSITNCVRSTLEANGVEFIGEDTVQLRQIQTLLD